MNTQFITKSKLINYKVDDDAFKAVYLSRVLRKFRISTYINSDFELVIWHIQNDVDHKEHLRISYDGYTS